MLTGPEIVTLYKMAKDKDEQIFILAELTASDADTIIEVLKDFGEYKEMNIQRCFNCHELYIAYNRCRVCQDCKRKARQKVRIRNDETGS